MINKDITLKRQIGPGLLKILAHIASHPAMANHVPAGPGSLATGQVGATASGGRLARRAAWQRSGSGSSAGYGGCNPEWSGA